MTDPAYLVAELAIRDGDAVRRYGRAVQPVMARFGGRIVATSLRNPRTIEGDARGTLLAVHRWNSQTGFDAFFASEEYRPLKELRRGACSSRIVIFDAAPAPTLVPALQGGAADPPVADDVRFLSPAAEYRGRADVLHVVRVIARVLEGVTATGVADAADGRMTTLTARIGDADVQGVLHERADSAGRLAEAALFLRPYAALREGIARMRTLLERDPLPGGAR